MIRCLTMRTVLGIALLSAVSAAAAGGLCKAAELVTFDGRPDGTVPTVARLVTGTVDWSGAEPTTDMAQSSTQLMDLLYQQGVPTVFNVVVSADGTLDAARLGAGVEAYGALARVVLVRLEGASNAFCKVFSTLPSVAFVWVAGTGGRAISAAAEPACAAPNILRVAPLRIDQTDLMASSNFGPTVRVAAIGEGVTAAGTGGVVAPMDGAVVAAARVAARLVDQAACGCYRSGAELISAFLQEGTTVIDSLRGKVDGGRAVID